MIGEIFKFTLGIIGILSGAALIGLSGDIKAISGIILMLIGSYIYWQFDVYKLGENLRKDG